MCKVLHTQKSSLALQGDDEESMSAIEPDRHEPLPEQPLPFPNPLIVA
jgi:hypothetical protein